MIYISNLRSHSTSIYGVFMVFTGLEVDMKKKT